MKNYHGESNRPLVVVLRTTYWPPFPSSHNFHSRGVRAYCIMLRITRRFKLNQLFRPSGVVLGECEQSQWPPKRKPSRINQFDSPVLHQEASLQKICSEKNQAAKKLIISSCTPTTSALLPQLYHYLLITTAVRPVRTDNNAAIRAYTRLFIYLFFYCCCTITTECVRTAVNNASYPQNSRRHGLYVLPILQPWG